MRKTKIGKQGIGRNPFEKGFPPPLKIMSFLFRCDGSREIGLGHVSRCLALADELKDRHHLRVAFAMRQDPVGFQLVREKGHRVFTPDESARDLPYAHYAQWLYDLVRSLGTRCLVLDVRDDLPAWAIEDVKKNGVLIATIDDPSERRLLADLAFYPPVPQVQDMSWTGFRGRLFIGWPWVLLRREFVKHIALKIAKEAESLKLPDASPRLKVLVSMGGSDPAGMTPKVVEAILLLADKAKNHFDPIIVLGPVFSYEQKLQNLLADNKYYSFQVYRDVKDMAGLMSQMDLAIVSFGITAYELASLGIPAVYLCLTPDHAESALSFARAGLGISLGIHSGVSAESLADVIGNLLQDKVRRESMAYQARQCIDGLGAERVARILVKNI